MTVTDYLLTFKLTTTSVQKATALREKAAALLAEDPDCKVISSAQAQDTHAYEVLGVDTAGRKPFKERTEAKDPEEAEAKVVGESKTKVVNDVRVAV